jgi:hypothetical protein
VLRVVPHVCWIFSVYDLQRHFKRSCVSYKVRLLEINIHLSDYYDATETSFNIFVLHFSCTIPVNTSARIHMIFPLAWLNISGKWESEILCVCGFFFCFVFACVDIFCHSFHYSVMRIQCPCDNSIWSLSRLHFICLLMKVLPVYKLLMQWNICSNDNEWKQNGIYPIWN